jgi:hypothetical protein
MCIEVFVPLCRNTAPRYPGADTLPEVGILAKGGFMETSALAQSAPDRYPELPAHSTRFWCSPRWQGGRSGERLLQIN